MEAGQDAVFTARLSDAVRMAEQKNRCHFVGFLDEREAEIARSVMRRLRFDRFLLWGGHEEAERVLFGAFPSYLDPEPSAFPLAAITARFRREDALSHRDFMGGLLSRGIQREALGDILLEEGRAVFFVREEVASFLVGQTEKIGRTGVKLMEGAEEPFPQAHRFEELSAVVASPRLDCVTAALAGLSREKAAAAIAAGLVTLNYREETSVSCPVEEGAKLSVRGKGKFVIDRLGPYTKKGRLCLTGRKYV